jgi:hypothetical protein
MEFLNQSYRTNQYRPSPEVAINREENILVISTPWGSRDAAAQINNDIIEYLANVKNDIELTSPFPLIKNLSSLANSIRTSILLANEFVYRHFNKDSYAEGLEILVVMKKQDELCIGSIGQPLVLAKYFESSDYLPIQIQRDQNPQSEPLPEDLLGLDSECYPHLISLKGSLIEEFLLLAHTQPSIKVLAALESSRIHNDKIEKWTQAIAQISPQTPFWIGQIKF